MSEDDFVTFAWLASKLGVNITQVRGWDARNLLPTVYAFPRGQVSPAMVSRKYAEARVAEWQRSCEPIEAARRIGLPERGGSIQHLIDREIVETITVFGRRRILRQSIGAGKLYVAQSPERLKELRTKLGKSGKGHRWNGTETNVHRWSQEEALRFGRKGNEAAARMRECRPVLLHLLHLLWKQLLVRRRELIAQRASVHNERLRTQRQKPERPESSWTKRPWRTQEDDEDRKPGSKRESRSSVGEVFGRGYRYRSVDD